MALRFIEFVVLITLFDAERNSSAAAFGVKPVLANPSGVVIGVMTIVGWKAASYNSPPIRKSVNIPTPFRTNDLSAE